MNDKAMTTSSDVERLAQDLSDDALMEMARAKRDRAAVTAALRELALRKSPLRTQVYAQVLADPEQSVAAKKAALTQLGREAAPPHEALLIQQLDPKEPALFGRAAEALGKIGGAQALSRLEEVPEPDAPLAREALAFARSLLSYRLRLDRHLISIPPPERWVDVEQGMAFETTAPAAEQFERARQDSLAELPAIPLTARGSVRLSCRGIEQVLSFTEPFETAEALRTLGQRPALLLVLLAKGTGLDRYSLANYFFTHLTKGDAVGLVGTRPSGELTYAGQVRREGSELVFTVKSVPTRYAPAIDVEGRYDVQKHVWTFPRARVSAQVAAGPGAARGPRKATLALG